MIHDHALMIRYEKYNESSVHGHESFKSEKCPTPKYNTRL